MNVNVQRENRKWFQRAQYNKDIIVVTAYVFIILNFNFFVYFGTSII